MIAANEDALICDFAETYGILDYRALPVHLLATLAVGLRDDARIKQYLTGVKVSQNTLLLAAAVDKLSFLAWTKTKSAQSGHNPPKSILDIVLGTKKERDFMAFDTGAEFEAERRRLLGEGG